MKVLIDTNVLLDVLQNRKPFVSDSLVIWNLCETGIITGYVSTLSIVNITYIMRKELSSELISGVLEQLNAIFKFADLSPEIVLTAAKAKWADFEDAIQAVTAKQNRCEYILSRNTKDYLDSEIPAMTPQEWIEQVFFS